LLLPSPFLLTFYNSDLEENESESARGKILGFGSHSCSSNLSMGTTSDPNYLDMATTIDPSRRIRDE
jgi:hypothetical protein